METSVQKKINKFIPYIEDELGMYKTKLLKSSENFQKKEGGPDRYVSNNKFSSVTLNELAMVPS